MKNAIRLRLTLYWWVFSFIANLKHLILKGLFIYEK